MTRGLKNAGITVRFGIDIDARFKESYEKNNRRARFLTADITRLGVSDLKRALKDVAREDILFAGCAPCQPFSQQRRTKAFASEGALLGHFARFVAAIKPGQVFIENVPGIRRVGGFSTYRRLRRLLDDQGYHCDEADVDAKRYGVPQNRRRYFLIAMRHAKCFLPPPSHGPHLLPFVTVREAIADYEPVDAGEEHPSIPNHVATRITDINLKRLAHTPHDGGDRRSWPRNLRLQCHNGEYNGHTDVYGRMYWDRPSPALTGRCHSISNGRYGHPEQDRAITLREAAKLQSFDDDYVFYGSNKSIALQIGNAVPVRLAEAVGRELLRSRRRAKSRGRR